MSSMPERTALARDHQRRDNEPGGVMGFLDHLEELRGRIIRSCAAVAVGMLVSFAFVDRIADVVLAPTFRALPAGAVLIYTKPGEAFAFDIDIALIAGVVMAAPYVMFQVWRFIAPGLYATEKRYVIPFVLLSAVGTLAGALFSHFVLFPAMMRFFRSFDAPRMRFMPRVEDTFELYKNVVLGMVVVFQLPTLVLFLARLRLVTARFLWTHIKYAVLIIFIVAAVLTPSADPWNQTIFAAPMIGLYVLSIGIAWLVGATDRNAGQRTDAGKVGLVVTAAVLLRQCERHDAAA